MRKETDLPKVKMIAHVLLDMPIAETSFSPAIVSHPFTSTGVTAAQNEDGNITVVDLLNNKEDYAKWKEMVGKQIDSAENACQVFFLPPGHRYDYAKSGRDFFEAFLSAQTKTAM